MISIVVPVYNAEKFIERTVQSVIDQTYKDWELLLVDDGSTDNTLQIMRGFSDPRIHVMISEKTGKACYARNTGIKNAKGRYLAFLDADDVWNPHKLERTLNHMIKNGAGFVFTSYEFGDQDARPTGKVVKVPERLVYKKALSRTVIFTSTVMIDFEKIPREKAMMPDIPSEDTATWWNILRTGQVAYGLNSNLVIYRRSSNTLSSNKLVAIKRVWNLYRKNEHLDVFRSAFYFCGWAFHAVVRRL